jgi:hypothetical protein
MFELKEDIIQKYKYLTPLILERPINRWVDPYGSIDWQKVFSPIESQTWMALRGFGFSPMYPQYPVNKYFLDFGNPKAKVAIECDGAEWHLDKEKDAKRDLVLLEEGWIVYRMDGSGCNKMCEEYYELPDFEHYDTEKLNEVLTKYYSCIEGLIKAIGIFHFGYKDYNFFQIELPHAFECLKEHISPIQSDFILSSLKQIEVKLNTEYYNGY